MYELRTLTKAVLLLFSFQLCACVSVDISGRKIIRSDSVDYRAPRTPFQEIESQYSDKIWKDNSSGATISYLSECDGPSDPSLEVLHKSITSDIESKETIESHIVDYNDRESLHTIVEGRVDGIPMRFELMIFKKNNCIFVLTYASKREVFSLHQREFLQFAKKFKVK